MHLVYLFSLFLFFSNFNMDLEEFYLFPDLPMDLQKYIRVLAISDCIKNEPVPSALKKLRVLALVDKQMLALIKNILNNKINTLNYLPKNIISFKKEYHKKRLFDGILQRVNGKKNGIFMFFAQNQYQEAIMQINNLVESGASDAVLDLEVSININVSKKCKFVFDCYDYQDTNGIVEDFNPVPTSNKFRIKNYKLIN